MYRIKVQSGFSLIELAIVLFILSLLLGSLLPPLSAQIEQKRREETQAQLEEIKEVLFGFTFNKNNTLGKYRLPCPDCSDNTGNCTGMTANDGQEDILSATTCATEIGNLPWVTLGVRENDAWGQRFNYRVTDDFADVTDGASIPVSCTSTTLNVSFALCSDGDIDINDNTGAAVAQDVPALVFSRGENYAETGSAFEQENTDGDKDFIYMDYSDDNTNGYDDLLIWISPHILRTKMLNAGILP